MTFFLLLLTYFYCKYWICVIVIDLWSGTNGDCISLAVTQSHIWALDRQTFQTIMMRSTQARHEEYFSFLRRYIHATNICAYLSVVNFTHTQTQINTHLPAWLLQHTFSTEYDVVVLNAYCRPVTNVYQCIINRCCNITVKIMLVCLRVECVNEEFFDTFLQIRLHAVFL